MKVWTLAILAIVAAWGSAIPTHAAQAPQVKRATDKVGNWIIEQYDPKAGRYGAGAQHEDIALQATIMAALCKHPRDYKERNGPYISAPVKFLAAQVGDDGKLKRNDTEAARQWVLNALQATENESYEPLINKLQGTLPMKKVVVKPDPAELKPADLKPETLQRAYELAVAAYKTGKSVPQTDGTDVVWADVLADHLLKLQQPDGKFGPDLLTNALALNILDFCYKSLK